MLICARCSIDLTVAVKLKNTIISSMEHFQNLQNIRPARTALSQVSRQVYPGSTIKRFIPPSQMQSSPKKLLNKVDFVLDFVDLSKMTHTIKEPGTSYQLPPSMASPSLLSLTKVTPKKKTVVKCFRKAINSNTPNPVPQRSFIVETPDGSTKRGSCALTLAHDKLVKSVKAQFGEDAVIVYVDDAKENNEEDYMKALRD